jgi:DNA gyrase subunit A
VLIRTRVNEIREMGRTAQGVTLMNLEKGEKLAGLSRIAEPGEEEGLEEQDSGAEIEGQEQEE